nr:hypothetical protein [Tanacetum cinerariifolium]
AAYSDLISNGKSLMGLKYLRINAASSNLVSTVRCLLVLPGNRITIDQMSLIDSSELVSELGARDDLGYGCDFYGIIRRYHSRASRVEVSPYNVEECIRLKDELMSSAYFSKRNDPRKINWRFVGKAVAATFRSE